MESKLLISYKIGYLECYDNKPIRFFFDSELERLFYLSGRLDCLMGETACYEDNTLWEKRYKELIS